MRQLILMRHGKTERNNPAGDHARALTDRGFQDIALIAARLIQKNFLPDAALVSDAMRTRQTIAALNQHIQPPATAAIKPELYLAEATEIVAEIRNIPEQVQTLIVIGHNPGLHELASNLATHRSRNTVQDGLTAGFPTSATAAFNIPSATWTNLTIGNAEPLFFLTPKHLR